MLDEIRLGEITLLHSVYEHINSNMYVLLAEDEALIIDPHKNEELTNLLKNKGRKRIIILLTHEHHDHTTGVYWYQEQFDSTLICQQNAAEYIAKKQYLRPTLIAFILGEEDHINGTHVYEDFKKSFVPRQYYADITYEEEYSFNWKNYFFQFYHIPGHSSGSSLIVLNGQVAFTGDSLLKDFPIILRFPGSNKADYEGITMSLLRHHLSSDMTILPGHGAPFVLKEIVENNKIYVQFR